MFDPELEFWMFLIWWEFGPLRWSPPPDPPLNGEEEGLKRPPPDPWGGWYVAKAAGSIQFLDFTTTSKNLLKGSGRASRFGGRLWLSSSAIAAAAGFLRQFQAEADCMEQAADGMKVPSTSPNSRNSSAKRIKTRKRQAVGKGGKFKTSKCVNNSQQYWERMIKLKLRTTGRCNLSQYIEIKTN